MDFIIISLYVKLLRGDVCSELFKDVHSYKTKSFQQVGQEATLVCPLFSGTECNVCIGQGFICRAVTQPKKRRNEIMFKYCVYLHQSA